MKWSSILPDISLVGKVGVPEQGYDVHNLDLASVGRSFGFVVPPHIDIGVAPSKKARPRKQEFGKDGQRMKKTKIFRQPNSKGRKFTRN